MEKRTNSRPRPPAAIQELDVLLQRIDRGEDSFAALSDEQRGQLTDALCEQWIDGYLESYPVPEDRNEAAREYHAIRSGERYPHLPPQVRQDLLIQFDQQFAEGGGPDHWAGAA